MLALQSVAIALVAFQLWPSVLLQTMAYGQRGNRMGTYRQSSKALASQNHSNGFLAIVSFVAQKHTCSIANIDHAVEIEQW